MSAQPQRPSTEILAALEHFQRDGDRLFGSGCIQISPVAVQIRESSEVVRAQVLTPAGTHYVFAKRAWPRPNGESIADVRDRLLRDFKVTAQAFRALKSTPDLRAVEPLACYDDLLCTVTREAPGIALDTITARTAAWRVSGPELERLAAIYQTVGRWVATFQQAQSEARPSHVSLDAARDYLSERLNRLVAIPRARFAPADRSAVLGHFDRLASRVRSVDLAEVATHGDVTPSNIIVGPDQVTVIDFAMAGCGSRFFDVARLFTQLEFYTAKPQFRRRVITRLQQALLSGFDPLLHDRHPLFEIYAVQHVVCHFVSHARQPGRFPVSLYSRHQCRMHHRWLRNRIREARRTDGPMEAAVERTL